MLEFQVMIAGPAVETLTAVPQDPFAVLPHSGGERVVQTIDKLGEIWDVVVDKLSGLAASAQQASSNAPFQLDEIEFHVGIEAGLNVGLVTKGDASVSLTFTRRPSTTRPDDQLAV